MSIQLRDGLANSSLDLAVEDLLVRFLVNVPPEDLSSIERVFFQVEEAQWFYTDFLRQLNPSLPSMKMKGFCSAFLTKCPLIWKWGDPSEAISRFGKYKSIIPVRGIALFNKDLTKAILVKGTESNTWSFPRGKISKDEQDLDCAIREVKEETSFDATDYVNENDVIERTIHGKNFKIYLARNVPEDFDFQPLVRNEIREIKWHDIQSLSKSIKVKPNNYFVVSSIIKPLTKWINKNRGVFNEEELMLKAEVGLKQLLGITDNASQTNADLGRELLNILQHVKPKEDGESQDVVPIPGGIPPPQQNFVQFALPQHVQNQIPFFVPPPNYQFYNPGPMLPPMGGMYPPFPPIITPIPTPAQMIPLNEVTPNANYVSQQPNPSSLQKPREIGKSSESNPRELLSLLNSKTKEKPEPTSSSSVPSSAGKDIMGLLSKPSSKPEADSRSILNILNKKSSSSSEGNGILNTINGHGSSIPSNELEQSQRDSSSIQQPSSSGKKITILKRSSDQPPPSQSQPSKNHLLSLIGNPQSKKVEPPKQTQPEINHTNAAPSQHSKNLLDLLKPSPQPSNTTTAAPSTTSITTATTVPVAPKAIDVNNASKDLLGMLHKTTSSAVSTPVVPLLPSQNSEGSQHGKNLLSLLHKTKSSEVPVAESNSPNQFLNLLSSKRTSVSQVPNDNSKPQSPNKHSTQLLGLLSKPTSAPIPAPASVPAPVPVPVVEDNQVEFEDFEDFEDFNDFDALNKEILGKSSFRSFDIESDEEDVDHLIDSYVPKSNTTQEIGYTQPRDFFIESKVEPKGGKVRLLKPGESLNGLFSSPDKNNLTNTGSTAASKSNSQGQNLLALLNNKNGGSGNQSSSNKPSQSGGFQSIYSSEVNSPSPISLGKPGSSINNQDGNKILKDLLWKRDP
ncbi:hypothetical protein DFJ63DRAFT_312758 [Scheffersomyces coipomensis]|uniref:uncharacterized protein n=1 Tax=Scheffersomyces coipomensis TaxID=1788519 RepID=UPI00315D3AFD